MEKIKNKLKLICILVILILIAYAAAYTANDLKNKKGAHALMPAGEPDIHRDDEKKSDGVKDSGDEIPELTENDIGQEIADFALQFIGKPYCVGGTSPETGFDCSGLVYYVLNNTGHFIKARICTDQYNLCRQLTRDELIPGDLIFFERTYGNAQITHVGIYIGGNRMVHAGDEICIENLEDDYWIEHLYGYGRFR